METPKVGRDNHMCASHMVLQRDLNPHETLYAGQASSYMIECGFLEAMDFLGTKHIVCQGLDGLRFVRPVKKGDAIHITTSVVSLGKSSVGIHIEMYVIPERIKAADCYVTFVTINEETGRAVPHNMVMAPLSEELAKHKERYEALRSVKRV